MLKAVQLLQTDKDSALDTAIKENPRLISLRNEQSLTLLHLAAQGNKLNCSLVLLYRGADPFATLPKNEWTPLHCAAQRDAHSLIQAYTKYKLPLDAVDAKGRTGLHIAASHGAENFIKAALESGMNVDAVNSSVLSKGWSPLHYACWHGQTDCVELLLNFKADVMATDKDGFSGLHLAVESGDITTVKLLLEAMKAKFTDSGWSQLLEEVKEIALRVNKHMAEFIERWNLPYEKLMKNEAFPLHAAVASGNDEALKNLLQKFSVNEKNAKGETCLHLTAKNGLVNMAKILLENGADLGILSRSKETALDVALISKNEKVACLLGAELSPGKQLLLPESTDMNQKLVQKYFY